MNIGRDVVNITNYSNCVDRDGFIFTAIVEPLNILNAIVVRCPEECDCWSPKYAKSNRSLHEHIDFINKHKLEYAVVIGESIEFILQCPTLKYIEIHPADSSPQNFDYSSLYQMPSIEYLLCTTRYGGCDQPHSTRIDYSKINGVKELLLNGSGHLNYNNINSLEKLYIGGDKSFRDLYWLAGDLNLKSLSIIDSSLRNLDGLSVLKNIQELSIENCRCLNDISKLTDLSRSLRFLTLENCPKITDFSCLYNLVNLEYLHLWGKNDLTDLSFLNNIKKLKAFSFSMNILDCNLSPCLNIPYVYSEHNKRQYNLKNNDLPKSSTVQQFELI